MKCCIFRRRKSIQGSKKESRYSFIHHLKWDHTFDMPDLSNDQSDHKMNSKKEIEDIVSNCLDKKRNEIPEFIKHLHKKRGYSFECTTAKQYSVIRLNSLCC